MELEIRGVTRGQSKNLRIKRFWALKFSTSEIVQNLGTFLFFHQWCCRGYVLLRRFTGLPPQKLKYEVRKWTEEQNKSIESLQPRCNPDVILK